MNKNIFFEVYEEFKKRKDSKSKQAFDVLDRDILHGIIVQDKTYWFEWTRYVTDKDIKSLNEVKNYLNNKGLVYLYD